TLTANYVFYGTDDRGIDGGYHFIKRVEENYGIDEQLSIRIEFDPDDTGDYETVFEGLLDIAGSTTLPDNKIQVPLVRDDFWTRFINRYDTPVDLTKNEDIDGNEVTPMVPVTLRMTPQKIRKRYMGTIEQTPPIVSIPNGEYFQLDFDKEEISEIAEKHLLARVVTSELPTWMFTIGEPGDY